MNWKLLVGGIVLLPFVLYAALYVVACLFFGVPKYLGPVSDHFDGQAFHNLVPIVRPHGPGRFLFARLWKYLWREAEGRPDPNWPVWVDDPPGPPPPER